MMIIIGKKERIISGKQKATKSNCFSNSPSHTSSLSLSLSPGYFFSLGSFLLNFYFDMNFNFHLFQIRKQTKIIIYHLCVDKLFRFQYRMVLNDDDCLKDKRKSMRKRKRREGRKREKENERTEKRQ